ncbi:hypothetical protein T265_11610 [Opisthorchis viverrini]|uniref:SEC63 domain-containing protein n=1 Tax=Opisthorchis viverrini TaxID=6198 RepID=A0A074YYG7_OPIVI|nr:hypothetical protein T265_11610 [Opisthorchis viverrini]KER19683.1 hypothetical protein T265_11610 [Opisthorchis viverrini]
MEIPTSKLSRVDSCRPAEWGPRDSTHTSRFGVFRNPKTGTVIHTRVTDSQDGGSHQASQHEYNRGLTARQRYLAGNASALPFRRNKSLHVPTPNMKDQDLFVGPGMRDCERRGDTPSIAQWVAEVRKPSHHGRPHLDRRTIRVLNQSLWLKSLTARQRCLAGNASALPFLRNKSPHVPTPNLEGQETVFGTWWYNTVKFSSNKVLLDTVRYFHCAFMRSPRMSMVQVIEVLSNAYEFNPNFNKEVVSRPSDNVELPPLIKDIPIFTIFKKSIFGSPSSVKARALIYAHLLHRQYIVKNCPRLIEEMMNRLMSVLAIAMEEAGSRLKTPPYLHTIENCMHLVPMLIQAVPPCASPLLQLPHLTQTQLRHMEAKQRNLKTIRQFVRLPEDKRRNLLRNLSDEEYRDVLNVCASMPSLEISYRCEVLDDDDPSIWPFSIITATILLKRFPLFDPSAQPTSSSSAMGSGSSGAMGGAAMVGVSALSDSHYSGTAWSSDWSAYNPSPNSQLYPAADFNADNGSVTYGDFGEEDAGDCATSKLQKPATKPVWDKGKKKKPTRKNNKQRKQEQRRQRGGQPTVKGTDKGAGNNNPVAQDEETNSEMEEADTNPVLDEDKPGDALLTRRKNSAMGDQMPSDLSAFGDHRQETERDGDEHDSLADGHLLSKSNNNVAAPRFTHSAGKQTTDRMNKSSESKPLHCSHVVHCPYFPMEKFEGWWIYVVDLMDRKTPRIITKPVYVATLQTEEEVALRFVAPANPGSYRYTLWVRSDSYVDCVFSDTLRFKVSSPPDNVARYLQSLDEAHSDSSGSGSESDDERSDVDLSDGEADEGVNNSTESDTDEEEATVATEDDSQANRLVSQCIS